MTASASPYPTPERLAELAAAHQARRRNGATRKAPEGPTVRPDFNVTTVEGGQWGDRYFVWTLPLNGAMQGRNR